MIQGREITGILFFLTFLLGLSGCGGSGDSGSSIGAVALIWEAPTTNSDGTPLTDLAGYKIYYRTSSGSYGTPINVSDENATNYTVDGISSDRWCFVVTAYDTSRNESNYSNEVCTDI